MCSRALIVKLPLVIWSNPSVSDLKVLRIQQPCAFTLRHYDSVFSELTKLLLDEDKVTEQLDLMRQTAAQQLIGLIQLWLNIWWWSFREASLMHR